MKKMLMVGAILSSLVFAKGTMDNNNTTGMSGMNMGNKMTGTQTTNLTAEQKKELDVLKESYTKVVAPLKISVQEKDLAIKKELLADKPNWTKIEALTKEKAVIESQIELATLKYKAEVKEKIGIDSDDSHYMDMEKDNKMDMNNEMKMKM